MQWLADKVDRVADISSLRGRHAKWQNPDILGITFKELLGQEILELTTVEVKPSMDSWQQYIFEAVSHSMFVHRAYFAFLHGLSVKDSEDSRSEHSVRTTFDLRKIGVSVQELLLSAKSAQKWPVFFFH